MKHIATSNPLLSGVLAAIALVWVGGRAMLGRHEGRIPSGIVAGDAGVILPADPGGGNGHGGNELFERIDRGAGFAEGVWVHGHVRGTTASFGGTLSFRPAEGTESRATRVQEDGFYELLLEFAGPQAITFTPEAGKGIPETVFLSATVPPGDEHALELSLPRGTINGRILSPKDDPVTGALVSLFPGPLGEEAPTGDPLATDTSDEQGRFCFVLLGDGTYNLFARSRNGRRFARRLVEVVGEDEAPEIELVWPE